jgi:hypothetical protein
MLDHKGRRIYIYIYIYILDGAAVYLLASRMVTVKITEKEKNMRHKHSTHWAPARS